MEVGGTGDEGNGGGHRRGVGAADTSRSSSKRKREGGWVLGAEKAGGMEGNGGTARVLDGEVVGAKARRDAVVQVVWAHTSHSLTVCHQATCVCVCVCVCVRVCVVCAREQTSLICQRTLSVTESRLFQALGFRLLGLGFGLVCDCVPPSVRLANASPMRNA